jgi:hypothetical protein
MLFWSTRFDEKSKSIASGAPDLQIGHDVTLQFSDPDFVQLARLDFSFRYNCSKLSYSCIFMWLGKFLTVVISAWEIG